HAERSLGMDQILLAGRVERRDVARAGKMERLRGHEQTSGYDFAFSWRAAELSLSQVLSKDCGRIRVWPTTGMKLLSPFHRGTMWPWRCGMLPPATAAPRLNPMLNPSGRNAVVRMRWPTTTSSNRSARSTAFNWSRSVTSRKGTASRWPGLYGKRFSTR